jgi:hypothetical protein
MRIQRNTVRATFRQKQGCKVRKVTNSLQTHNIQYTEVENWIQRRRAKEICGQRNRMRTAFRQKKGCKRYREDEASWARDSVVELLELGEQGQQSKRNFEGMTGWQTRTGERQPFHR